MIEALPKIADVKTLKELSKVLVFPMLMAAYIAQTGLTVSIGIFYLSISPESSFLIQALVFLIILVIKGFAVGVVVGFPYLLLCYAHIFTSFTALQIFAGLFLTFGFLGVFAGDELVFLNTLNRMWFYTAFVMGFSCLASAADIERSLTTGEM